MLDNLRLIAGVASCFPRVRERAAGSSAATPADLGGGLFARRAVQALVGFAALQAAATLLLLPWAWEPYHRELGDLAVNLATLLIASSVSAVLFLFGGYRDRRSWLLGAYFLVQATLANPFPMLASLRDIPQADLFGYPYVYPFLFASCVPVGVRAGVSASTAGTLDSTTFARRMVVVSAALGCVMWMALVAVLEVARAGYLAEAVFWTCFDASLALLELLRLWAVGVLVLRARTAPTDEVRRVVLFAVGFLIWSGAIHRLRPGRGVFAGQLAVQLSVDSRRGGGRVCCGFRGSRCCGTPCSRLGFRTRARWSAHSACGCWRGDASWVPWR